MQTYDGNRPSQGRPTRRATRLVTTTRILKGVFLRYGYLLFPALATVLILSSTYILLGPVLNRSGDNIYHLMTEYSMAYSVKYGDNPLGPLGLEFGVPLMRFYQCLFYLINVGLSIVAGMDLRFAHNLTIVVCFAASPFSYVYFLRKLRLNRWAAGIGGFLSIISVAAFGNSFEAYHQAGIVTQSLGGLFFPLFMGSFIGMMRGENRATTTAFLFAVAFLSHAIMSVFAAFSGALYFLVSDVGLRRNWRRLAIFGAIGLALVSFWVLPFIDHTYEKRAIPDSIIRGKGVHWFTSVSRAELSTVLLSGRLLDDPPRKGKDRDADDKYMDKISIIGTLKTRPPIFTVLTAFGALVALFGLRRTSLRFLLSGLVFSLMLFAGPDDFSFCQYLPFIKHIHTFRFTYLIEFFAFGLAAAGIETVLRQMYNFARTRNRFLRYPLSVTWLLIAASGASWVGSEIVALGQTHLLVRQTRNLDAMVDAMRTMPDRGYPFRVDVQFPGRRKIRHAWLSAYDFHPYCTHWKGLGPTPNYYLCSDLGSFKQHLNLYALAGVRWVSGQGDNIKAFTGAKDDDGDDVFERLANGKDRRGKNNAWHHMLDSGRDHFLRPLLGPPIPVICNDAQWIWLSRSWTRRFRSGLWNPNTPVTIRVEAGQLGNSGLLNRAAAVFYLDHSRLADDHAAITSFTAEGGLVVTPVEIPGVSVKLAGQSPLWDNLPFHQRRTKNKRPPELEREELDPGLDVVEITRHRPRGRTRQLFAFDVDALKPVILVLPMQRYPGWHAELNGAPYPLFSIGPDMIGVHVPRGVHRLVFRWKMPGWHAVYLLISCASLAIVFGVWIYAGYRRLRGRRVPR